MLVGLASRAPRVTTADLVEPLRSAPALPWRATWKDPAAVPRELAALLAPCGIAPAKLRPIMPDGRHGSPVQGYVRASFDLAAEPEPLRELAG